MIELIPSEQLLIRVSDTGCGIPKNFRAALFEPFRQADTSLTRPRQGTGLGLSIVKHLVQRMSGTVDVDSTEGEGSTFTIKLPITSPPVSSAQHLPTPPLIPPAGSATVEPERKKRIRVVNRHKKTEGLLVELWNQHGHVAFPGDGRMSAKEMLNETDVIWADLESVAQSATLRSLMRSRPVALSTETQPTNQNSKYTFSTPSSISATGGIPLFVVYSERPDLSLLEPELSSASNVVLVKRPTIIHNVLAMVEDPQAHMGSHLVPGSPKVRFVIPHADRERGEKSHVDGGNTVMWSKEGENLTGEREKNKVGEETVLSTPIHPQRPSAPSTTGMSLLLSHAESVIPTPELTPQAAEKENVLLVEDNLVSLSIFVLP